MPPLITVIIPVKNNREYLKKALSSIRGQTHTNLEIMIIDDGSDIPLEDVVKKESDTRIKYFRHEKSKGLPASINVGLKNGTGNFFARQDSDDWSMPERFSKQLAMFEGNVGFVSTWGKTVDQNGNPMRDGYIGHKIRRFKAPVIQQKMLSVPANFILGPSMMFKREVYEKIGLSDEFFTMGEDDFNYWVRGFQFFDLRVVEEELYVYRRHRGSMRTVNHPLTPEQRQAVAYERAYTNTIIKGD